MVMRSGVDQTRVVRALWSDCCGVAQGGDALEYDDSLIPDSSVEAGVLPTEIRKLVQSRRVVRQMMKAADITPDQYTQVFTHESYLLCFI